MSGDMLQNIGKFGKKSGIDLQTFNAGLQRANLKTDVEKSIFDSIDTDKNGVLTKDEIENFQKSIDTSGDNQISKKEAKNYLKSNNLNKTVDKKDLLKFLQEYNKNTENVEDVSVTEDAKGKTIQIKYKEGTLETINPNKTSQLVKTDENDVTTIKFLDANKTLQKECIVDKNGNKIETDYAEDGETVTRLTETRFDSGEITTTNFADGKPESKTVKTGITTSYYSFDADGNEVLNLKVENEGIPAKEKRTEYQYNEDGTVLENITETGKVTVLLTKDGQPLVGQIKEGDTITDRTYYERGYSDKSTDANGNITITDSSLEGHRLAQKKIIDGKEYIAMYDGEGNTNIVVQNGESLATIAKKFNCTEAQLKELNAGSDALSGRNLKIGAELKVPGELDADAKALQGRKSSEETIADYQRDQAIIAQKKAQAAAREAQYKAMGLINHKDQGKKIVGKYKGGQTEEFTVIGQCGRERYLAKNSKGKIITIAQDGVILKEEYAAATNLFDKGEKVNGTIKMRKQDGSIVTVNKKFVKVGILEKGRSAVLDEKGKAYVMGPDGKILDLNFVQRDREADVLKKDPIAARNATLDMMDAQINEAQAAFDKQMADDGWAGDLADGISRAWTWATDSKNSANYVREDLAAYKKDLAALKNAAKQGDAQFRAKFKQMFGIEYNQNNVANYYLNPTAANYQKAFGTKNDIGTRVAKYNESQKTGADVVKTGAKVIGGIAVGAAAAATGGTALVALGAASIGTGLFSAAVDETDRMKIGQAITKGKVEFREGTDHKKILIDAAWDAGSVLAGYGVGEVASTVVKGRQVFTAGGQAVNVLTKTEKVGRAAINITGDIAFGAAQERIQTGKNTLLGTVLNGATSTIGQGLQTGTVKNIGNKIIREPLTKGRKKVETTINKLRNKTPEPNVSFSLRANFDPVTPTPAAQNVGSVTPHNSENTSVKPPKPASGDDRMSVNIPTSPSTTSSTCTPENFSAIMRDLKKTNFIYEVDAFTPHSLDYSNFTPEQKTIIMSEINKKRLEIATTKPEDRAAAKQNYREEVAENKRSDALQDNRSILLNLNDRFKLADDLYLDFSDPHLRRVLEKSKSGDKFIIGRSAESSEANILIDNPNNNISRHHVVIENIDGNLYATNLCSTNGTTLSNTKIRELSALKGTIIREGIVNASDLIENLL